MFQKNRGQLTPYMVVSPRGVTEAQMCKAVNFSSRTSATEFVLHFLHFCLPAVTTYLLSQSLTHNVG